MGTLPFAPPEHIPHFIFTNTPPYISSDAPVVQELSSKHLAGFVEDLQISKVHPPKVPLRTSLEGITELMTSIQDKGLLHPIIVRPVNDKFEVVAGHRRYHACKKLRWARIPAQVVEADDREAFEIAITENLQHETLSPLETAVAFKKYVAEYGYGGVSELAMRIGKSEQYVSQYLQLLKLPPSVIEKVSTRVVSLAQARELFSLNQEQQEAVVEAIARKKLSSRQVKDFVSVLKENDSLEFPFGNFRAPSASARRMHDADRVVGKCLGSLKMCLMRFDELLNQIAEDEFILKESLIGHRISISHQIDSLIRLRKRIRQAFR